MQFNDTTNLTGLIQDCERKTGLGIGNISGSTNRLKTFTHYLNERLFMAQQLILNAQDDWDLDDSNNTDLPIATTPLTTNRDYSFSSGLSILKLKGVSVGYDASNYYDAERIATSDIPGMDGNEATSDSYYSKTAPKYDLVGSSLLLYPKATTADVTAGGKIQLIFDRRLSTFTTGDTTKEPGFEKSFHKYLSIGASVDYSIDNDLTTKLSTLKLAEAEIVDLMTKFYGSRDEGDEMALVADSKVRYE